MADLVKCLVWDLDNTLWQGTLLEDGDVPLFAGVRDVIRELDERGILQSVSSKNDPELAGARLEALGLAEYFLAPQIGWGRKSDAIRAIAEQLNFAYRTIAFVDDQPIERAEVAYHLPEVRCFSAEGIPRLIDLADFTPASRTVDSRRRRQMYRAGLLRDRERAEFAGPDEDFLRTLELELAIERATDDQLSRVEELTVRTSQMNATGVHYSDAPLRALQDDPGHEVLVVTMSDRFGSHGAVGVVLLAKHAQVWHLKLLATSCRVVSLGAGSTLLSWLTHQAAVAGVHLVADFRPTDRNRMMEIAYRFAGFDDAPCRCRGEVDCVETGVEGVQQLHLLPTPQPPSRTVRIQAAELAPLVPAAGGGQLRGRRSA